MAAIWINEEYEELRDSDGIETENPAAYQDIYYALQGTMRPEGETR